jgi:hypothetical protein
MDSNTLQRVIILLWIVAVVVPTAFPPWTVNETLDVVKPKQSEIGYEEMHSQGTANWFRWFLAPSDWWVDARLTAGVNRIPMTNPGITSHFNGAIRYDLLALELFIVSALASGQLLITRKGGDR